MGRAPPSHAPLELVLPDRSRLPLLGEVAIGRAPGSTLLLSDPTVSRAHARISATRDGAVLEDVGSSYGTWVDGDRVTGPTALRDGARIRVGDQELLVERRRDQSEAGLTNIVPVGASLNLPRVEQAAPGATAATRFGLRPRVRSGYAFKRLEAGEGDRRWVLKDLRSGRFVRMGAGEAELFELIDGRRSLAELVREAEQRLGADGPPALVQLLSELADRGFLAGVAQDDPQPAGGGGMLRRAATPRQWTWSGAGAWFDRVYRSGGRALLTPSALAGLGALAAVGALAFAYLVAGRYGTPFVVASKLGLGGLVFLIGRFALAAAHETAHGLVMSSFGRRVHEAGLKVVLVFPYVFVDTSDAWFEPRRRRMAVSAAGPASDLVLGGFFSIISLMLPAGAGRDICFQLAFGAYLASFFNLNPLLPRDGYHVLADLLGDPGLRDHAREQLWRRLSGRGEGTYSRVLARYSLFSVAWSTIGAGLAAAASLRYQGAFLQLVPPTVVWPVTVMIWIALFLPVLLMVGGPLIERHRSRSP